jgi:hypothetical protein
MGMKCFSNQHFSRTATRLSAALAVDVPAKSVYVAARNLVFGLTCTLPTWASDLK